MTAPDVPARLLLVSGRYSAELERVVSSVAQAVTVFSFEEAEPAIADGRFTCVLVDPAIAPDAFERTRQLRARHPQLEFVILSEDDWQRSSALTQGVEALHPKADGVLEHLRRVLEARRLTGEFEAAASQGWVNIAYEQLLEAFVARTSRTEIAAIAAIVAQHLLRADGASVNRVEGSRYTVIGASGQLVGFRGTTAPLEGSRNGEVYGRGAAQIVEEDAARFDVAMAATGVVSMAVAPIRLRGRPIGLLEVSASATGRFGESHVALLQGLADLIAIGLALAEGDDLRATFLRDLVNGIEEERGRLARELHDEAGQLLTSLLVRLHALDAVVPAEAQPSLVAAQQLASRTLVEMQRIARGLKPAIVTELSFEQAVRRLADEHQQTHGVPIDLMFNGFLSGHLPTATEVALYRIVQEALTNIAKHASASNIGIVIRRANGKIRLIVDDDGTGLDPSTHSEGSGLSNIAERAELLNGRFTLESSPGVGTTIYVEIPVPDEP